ncbi:unnamed protein product [Bursaphelenchus xylophilus]|uniref:(pine wood nematode) hypothetical protein n=1 Tax=Bursaphelenchus xylophilus TaxID=6326 RepID=A0A1I7SFW8_BURXY|nr:unnamed protein product [Bursaphelenchus xylophilus]CAG9113193.1 unnamed protein product [Bursaphelenchus xylophilus]
MNCLLQFTAEPLPEPRQIKLDLTEASIAVDTMFQSLSLISPGAADSLSAYLTEVERYETEPLNQMFERIRSKASLNGHIGNSIPVIDPNEAILGRVMSKKNFLASNHTLDQLRAKLAGLLKRSVFHKNPRRYTKEISNLRSVIRKLIKRRKIWRNHFDPNWDEVTKEAWENEPRSIQEIEDHILAETMEELTPGDAASLATYELISRKKPADLAARLVRALGEEDLKEFAKCGLKRKVKDIWRPESNKTMIQGIPEDGDETKDAAEEEERYLHEVEAAYGPEIGLLVLDNDVEQPGPSHAPPSQRRGRPRRVAASQQQNSQRARATRGRPNPQSQAPRLFEEVETQNETDDVESVVSSMRSSRRAINRPGRYSPDPY